MGLLARKKQVAIKAESVEGTAVALAAADAGLLVYDVSWSPDVEQFERKPFRDTIGRLASLAGVRPATLAFETELVGSGSIVVSPPWKAAIEGAGFSEGTLDSIVIGAITGGPYKAGEIVTGATEGSATVAKDTFDGETLLYIYAGTVDFTTSSQVITGATSTAAATSGAAQTDDVGFQYHPNSTPPISRTVGLYNDGLKHTLKGARANLVLRAETTGAPIRMAFEYQGAIDASADIPSLSGIVFPTLLPPQFQGADFSVNVGPAQANEYLSVLDSFELSIGNDIQLRRNANDAAGIISAQIAERAGSGSFDPEAVTVAVQDFWNQLYNSTPVTIETVIGSAAGNKFIIQAPLGQYSGISSATRGPNEVNNTDLQLNEGTIGDHELVVLAI